MSEFKINCMLRAGGFAVRALCNALLVNAVSTSNAANKEEAFEEVMRRMHSQLDFMNDAINNALGED